MKNLGLICIILTIVLVVCGCNNRKSSPSVSSETRNYIGYTPNANGYCSVYSEDGHTFIYEKDSIGDYIVYYAKFDDNAGKHGHDRIKDKVVRIVVNDSLDRVLSISSICCGIFIEKYSADRYKALCVDEHMNVNIIDNTEFSCGQKISTGANMIESEILKIISLLSIATRIVYSINTNSSICWNNMALALEPIQNIMSRDIILYNTIANPKIQKHVLRIEETKNPLSVYHYMLVDNCKEKDCR